MTKLVGGTDKRGVSRRSLLKGAGTAALLAAAKTAFPGGANVAWAAGPEVKGTKLGYIALTDACAADHRQGERAFSPSTACPTSRC